MRGITRGALPMIVFALVPLMNAVAPLVVIPVISSRFGASGWAAVAVGLSMGVAASVVAELGWAIVGPQKVARAPHDRRRLYELSLASKLVAVVVLAPVAGLVSAAVVHEHRGAAGLLAVAVTAAATSPAWFFTGLGQPIKIFLADAIPRAVAAIGSAFAISAGAGLEVYGIGILLAAAVGLVIAAPLGTHCVIPCRSIFREVPGVIRQQRTLIVGRGISTLYKSMAVGLIAFVNPASVVTFAALDRPLRMGLTVLAAVPSRLQSWVGVPDRCEAAKRARVSIVVNAMIGFGAGLACAAVMPSIANVLFAGVVSVDSGLAALGGGLIAIISLSRGLGLALVAADRADATTSASAVSAVVGLSGVLVGAALYGARGAVAALVAAELVGAVVQATALWRGRESSTRPLLRKAV